VHAETLWFVARAREYQIVPLAGLRSSTVVPDGQGIDHPQPAGTAGLATLEAVTPHRLLVTLVRLFKRSHVLFVRQGGFALTCRGSSRSRIAAWNQSERARLAAERARIEHALSRVGRRDTGEEADEDDPINRASDLYQDEFDEGRADDLREELAAVERAEARLATGTYGLSIKSGAPIPDERLEANPDSRAHGPRGSP
jgi:RNA polymerase-binding transcription factor